LFKVHFFNVGHGECSLIEHPSGRLTMVDINTSHGYDSETQQEIIREHAPSGFVHAGGLLVRPGLLTNAMYVTEAEKAELTDPIEYLKKHYPGRRIWRFILTHPDIDHLRGLKRLRETIGIDNFWDTQHTKTTPAQFRNDHEREEWQHYLHLRAGQLGLQPLFFTRGDRAFAFAVNEVGQPGGDGIEILSPTPALIKQCNDAGKSNDLSIVLRVSHARRSVLLTGDIEKLAWDDLVASYGAQLKSDFLQASHHGRDTGYHLDALKLIAPEVVVVSVGRKPATDASHKYRGQCNSVFSTRYYGNLTLEIGENGAAHWVAQRNGG
jgi:beta-lactamase superfamily II metal-dependent hydrolase